MLDIFLKTRAGAACIAAVLTFFITVSGTFWVVRDYYSDAATIAALTSEVKTLKADIRMAKAAARLEHSLADDIRNEAMRNQEAIHENLKESNTDPNRCRMSVDDARRVLRIREPHAQP